ncbi:hypothetical protein [Leptolyngbya sp. BC1307]|uniref:hypothetical protein n=1 Tax=Leptolyngbya sp. BC1307 TaxID=2029589 RepID=UPI001140ACB8|nr:hypothetical protein [Leptolyngbya sp. BC1307]
MSQWIGAIAVVVVAVNVLKQAAHMLTHRAIQDEAKTRCAESMQYVRSLQALARRWVTASFTSCSSPQ